MPSLRRPPVILNQGVEHRFTELLNLAASQPWMSESLCVDYQETFNMEPGLRRGPRKAKIKEAESICRACPVIVECSNWASSKTWSDIVVAGKYYPQSF